MVALAALAFTSCTTVTPGWGNVNNFSGLDDVLNNVRGDKYISNIGNESVSSEKIGKAGSVFVFGLILFMVMYPFKCFMYRSAEGYIWSMDRIEGNIHCFGKDLTE